jgi:glutathione S-transferase
MIRLHQLPSEGWGVANPSPFCLKVETYLRMVKAPYEVCSTLDTRPAPKGKVPWIEEGSMKLGDSAHILEHLEKTYGLDNGMSDRDRAIAHLVRRTLEESLYFKIVYTRWWDDAGWAKTKPLFFNAMPQPLRTIGPLVARPAIKKMLKGQGTGRHSLAEILDMGRADLDAVADILGDKPFVLGDTPRTVDATTFAFVENILHNTVRTPLTDHALSRKNLPAYVTRMKERFWS